MFKAEITEEYTKIQGTGSEKLAGLSCYIEALRKAGMPDVFIKKAIKIGFEDLEENEEDKKIETILDNDNVKIQKFDLNNLTKEEAKEFFEKEIFNKMFD